MEIWATLRQGGPRCCWGRAVTVCTVLGVLILLVVGWLILSTGPGPPGPRAIEILNASCADGEILVLLRNAGGRSISTDDIVPIRGGGEPVTGEWVREGGSEEPRVLQPGDVAKFATLCFKGTECSFRLVCMTDGRNYDVNVQC